MGALAGLAKSELLDRAKQERQLKLQAMTARLSPWTGLRPQNVEEPDTGNAVIQGAIAGDVFRTQNESDSLRKQLVDSQIAANRAAALRATMGTGQSGWSAVPQASSDSFYRYTPSPLDPNIYAPMGSL